MANIGASEIIVIALILILLFGGKKIPEFFKGLGEGISQFKKSSKDSSDSNKE